MQLAWYKKSWFKLVLFTIGNFLLLGLIFWIFFSYPELDSIDEVKIIELTDDGIIAETVVSVRNNNIIGIKGRDVKMNLSYKGKNFAKGNVVGGLSLEANTTTKVTSKITFKTTKIKDFWNDFVASDSLKVDTYFEGTFSPLGITQSYEQEMYIASDEMIEMMISEFMSGDGTKFKNVRPIEVGLKEWVWSFDFELSNELPVDLNLQSIKVNVYESEKSEKSVGFWRTNNPIIVNAGSRQLIPGELTITLGGLVGGVIDKIKNPTPTMFLSGELVVLLNNESFKVNFDNTATVDLLGGKVQIDE